MLVNTIDLVREARSRRIAIGAFNTYNLELTRAIVAAAEKLSQPIILQLGVSAIKAGGEPLALATLAAARVARVRVAVHLDHCPDIGLIEACFAWGFSSALADGSRQPFVENIAFTRRAVELAARYGGTIEAERRRFLMRQSGGGVCRLRTPIARCAFPKEGSVEQSLRYQARRVARVNGRKPVGN